MGRWPRLVPVGHQERGVLTEGLAFLESPSGLQSQGGAQQGGQPGRDRRVGSSKPPLALPVHMDRGK